MLTNMLLDSMIWAKSLSWPMFASVAIGTSFTLFFMMFTAVNRFNPEQRSVSSRSMWQTSPLVRSEWLSQHLGAGNQVQLKMESLQPSGSFKIRGISAFMRKMFTMTKSIDTFVTTSSANAGMAVAYCARELGCKCLVILDESQRDNALIPALTSGYGAKVEFKGETWNDADEYALAECSKSQQLQYVPMFDDPTIFHGHSSLVNELGTQTKRVPDCIVCAVGGGGLLMGVLSGLYQVGWTRSTKVVAAQSQQCALLHAAIANGHQPMAVKCISPEGVDLGYRAVAPDVMRMTSKFSKFNPIKSLLVRDEDVLNTATLFGLKERVLVEPLCAVAVTAVLMNKEYFQQFEDIVVIVCGGNHVHFDVEMLSKWRENGIVSHQDLRVMQKAKDSSPKEMEEITNWDDETDSYDSDTEEM